MATMTMTRTRTVAQTTTQQPPQHAAETHQTTVLDEITNGRITPQERAEADDYLDRIPGLGQFRPAGTRPRTLRLILQSNATTRSRGSSALGSSIMNSHAQIRVLVLEPGDVNTKRWLLSLDDLRAYLRGNTDPKRRVFLVSKDSLTDEVVGLLGYRLGLDPDFFAIHATPQEPPLELSLPSSIVYRQNLRFDYCRVVRPTAEGERMSLSVSQKINDTWTSVILLNDYDLNEQQMVALKSHLRDDQEDSPLNIFEALAKSIFYSTYADRRASGSLAAVLYSVFPILVSHWTDLVSSRRSATVDARKTINELSEGNLSGGPRAERTARLQDLIERLHRFGTYTCIDFTLKYLEDCERLQARLDPRGLVDIETIKNDVSLLVEHRNQLDQENEVLFSKQSSLSALAAQSRNNPPPRDPPGQSREYKDPPGPRLATAAPEDTAVPPSGIPPGSNPPGADPANSFANHVQMKIDQIAYMTNILFSLTFIASVYGMNLNIFTEDGKVGLVRFLATALPFAFVVFVITFVLPEVVFRISGRRRRGGVNVDPI